MKTLCRKFLNLAHYFPYDVKLRLLAHSQSFLANQKARNAIVGAENLLNGYSSVSGQGEPNVVQGLATEVGKMGPACLVYCILWENGVKYAI